MALPSSGPISLGDVNIELGLSATAQISMGDSAVRTLFGIGSGVINMQNGRGKANQFAFTIASNQTNADLATLATNAGWNGTSKVVATIGSGIYISSNSTGTPALTVPNSFPGGVELINNGYIVGMGGNGGAGGYRTGYSWVNSTSGAAGGTALTTVAPVTVTNNGTIAGGGGGGGGGGATYVDDNNGGGSGGFYGGGGGGGGRSSLTNSNGGSGGSMASASQSWTNTRRYSGSAGSGGTVSSAGGGGPGAGAAGGAGGSWGSNGNSGNNAGGYSWWTYIYGASAGSGGAAVSGNGNITWVSTGTRYGAIA